MAIRLEIQPYCSDCCDFEADVTKPERKQNACTGDLYLSDTIIHCKNAKRCEAIKRYLTNKSKEAKE